MENMPKPMNRGILVDNPMYEISKGTKLVLEGVDTKSLFGDKLAAKFPNGIIRYTVLAIADDVTGIEVGDEVVINPTATHRLMAINQTKEDNTPRWLYMTQGDIALKYSKQ